MSAADPWWERWWGVLAITLGVAAVAMSLVGITVSRRGPSPSERAEELLGADAACNPCNAMRSCDAECVLDGQLYQCIQSRRDSKIRCAKVDRSGQP